MAGKGCLATAFHGELSAAKHDKRPLSAERLQFMTDQVKDDHIFPWSLGRTLFHSGDCVGAISALKGARDRLLNRRESQPNNPKLAEDQAEIEKDIEESEAALI